MATLKQKIVAKDLLENVGKPIGKAMLDAGYSPATAKNPDHLTESKGFQELLRENGLDEKKLKNKLKEWIDAVKIQSSMTEPDRIVPDYPTQLKAGEMLSDYLEVNKNPEGKFNKMTVTFE